MRVALALGVLAACGGSDGGAGNGGRIHGGFDTSGGTIDFDQPCKLTNRTDSWDISAIDSAKHYGVEATWKMTAITAPGTYTGSATNGIFLSIERPDPADSSKGVLVLADGTLEFDSYDPGMTGVSGALAWTDHDEPTFKVTMLFDCR